MHCVGGKVLKRYTVRVNKARLELCSDGVFAIMIRVLVLASKVPNWRNPSDSDLWFATD